MFDGYVDDCRNTDNAWVENTIVNIHLDRKSQVMVDINVVRTSLFLRKCEASNFLEQLLPFFLLIIYDRIQVTILIPCVISYCSTPRWSVETALSSGRSWAAKPDSGQTKETLLDGLRSCTTGSSDATVVQPVHVAFSLTQINFVALKALLKKNAEKCQAP